MDEDVAKLYMTSLLEPEGYSATITSFRDVVSAYKFLHPCDPLPAAHPIHPIKSVTSGGGGVIDTVSQGIIDNIHKIYGNEFGVSLYVDTYLHYLHTEKKTMLLAFSLPHVEKAS